MLPAPRSMLKQVLRVGLTSAVLGLLILAYPAYVNSLGLLCVDSGPVKAGAIVMLGGGTPDRHHQAAQLYLAGAAPLLIISGDGAEARELLVADGVPQSAIRVEPSSKSTWENAQFATPLLRQAGITNAIIVTSWYHSRRSLGAFRLAGPEIQFYSRPSYWAAPIEHWPRSGLPRVIIAEYFKIAWYWLRH